MDEETSSSSEEDEDGMLLNEEFDKKFYKTLALLKSKDPKIYDKDFKCFDDSEGPKTLNGGKEQGVKRHSERALFLRDYERKIILERNGKLSDSEDEDTLKQRCLDKYKPTYVQEQQDIKESFKKALNDDDGEDNDLLKPKEKTEDEKKKEESEYKKWLKGQEANIDEQEKKELKSLRDYWADPNLDENEKFIRDYILNNKFLEKDFSQENLDYNHVIHDSDENLSEDERTIEKQEEFECKYNFRFQEPDPEFIKRYPRTIGDSLRRKNTKRAEKRAEVKKRKEEEKLRKQEELKQLKAMKRKEIEEKILKLKEITGNNDLGFDNTDFEADFDPEEHDRKMKEIFNDEYYSVANEAVKPEFPDMDEELGIEKTWDDYDPNNDDLVTGETYEPHCEDPDFNMDADYDSSKHLQNELLESSKKKKRKRRGKFAELIAKEKPKFDPKMYKSYEDYFDQYYSLDYEDMIGDLPCRFKYRKVVPNDYGLSVEEILMADDKELNKWCSLKKALEYKTQGEEMREFKTYKARANDEGLKRKILKSLYSTDNQNISDNEGTLESKKKRKRKKKSSVVSTEDKPEIKIDASEGSAEVELTLPVNSEEVEQSSPKKLKSENKKSKMEQGFTKKLNGKDETALSIDKISHDNNCENDLVGKKKNQYREKRKISISSESDNLNNKKLKKENNTQETNYVANCNTDKSIQKKENKKKKGKSKYNAKSIGNDKTGGDKNKLKKHKKNPVNDSILSIKDERLKMYGLNPKKLKNKIKYGQKN
ncbi:protein KRI1 homolog isoform X2 [Prorops nasuta]